MAWGNLHCSRWDDRWLGMEPMPSCIGRHILNHWTTREVPPHPTPRPICLLITSSIVSITHQRGTFFNQGWPYAALSPKVHGLPSGWVSLVAQLVKKSTCNEGDLGLIPGLGRSHGEGKGYPLQYSGLENSVDYIVHGVTKSRTRLNDFHFHFLSFSLSAVHSTALDKHIMTRGGFSGGAGGKEPTC